MIQTIVFGIMLVIGVAAIAQAAARPGTQDGYVLAGAFLIVFSVGSWIRSEIRRNANR